MSATNTDVILDDHGVLRVGGTHVMLDSLLAAYEQGHSAETIGQQYPSLSLAQVEGAIYYYLTHREEVEQYLVRQNEQWAKWRRIAGQRPSPVADRLRSSVCRVTPMKSMGLFEASKTLSGMQYEEMRELTTSERALWKQAKQVRE